MENEKDLVEITIPKRMLEFFQETAHEIRNQNNRGTAQPYYYTVRTHRHMWAYDGAGDKEVMVLMASAEGGYNGDPIEFDTLDIKKARKILHETYGFEREDLDEIGDAEFKIYSVHEVYDHQNVFLTEKGYEEHMRLNGHNIRGDFYKEPHSFLMHAFRNPEMQKLIEAVLYLGGEA